MSVTVINVLLFVNAAIAGLSARATFKAPIVHFSMLLSTVLYGVFLAGDGFQAHIVWPAIALSVLFYFYDITAVVEEKRAPGPLAVFLGFYPVILSSTENLFVTLLSLLVFIVGCQFANAENEKKTSVYRTLMQTNDSLKYFCVLLVFYYAHQGLVTFDLSQRGHAVGLASIALSVTLIMLALLFLGVFAGSKESLRRLKSFSSSNIIFEQLIKKTFVPGFLLITAKSVMAKMEFFDYLFSQKLILAIFFLTTLISLSSILKDGKKAFGFFKYYFIFGSGLFLTLEKISDYDYILFLMGVNCLLLVCLYNPHKSIYKKINEALKLFVFPSAFSPFIWLLYLKAIEYEGPNKAFLLAFSTLSVFSGLFVFNKKKHDLSVLNNGKILNPINLVGITIMTFFVSFLIIAKMLT